MIINVTHATKFLKGGVEKRAYHVIVQKPLQPTK